MREPDAITSARCALGTRLAACRRAAGLTQMELASLIAFSRSTIANVETGRQHVPRGFWESADTAVRAGGALVAAHEELEAAVRHARVQRAAFPAELATLPAIHIAGQLPPAPAPDGTSTEPDLITAAAHQARDYAARAAVTGIGPGTVEQLTAQVVRLARAYVAAPPLPLFAAMHQALGQVQAALEERTHPPQARDLNFLAGALCGLLANASLDLGREDAADDLTRAGGRRSPPRPSPASC